jgi:ribonuclease J
MGPPTLTGFGGVGEIGGNAFLLEDGRSRILLDVGRRFGTDRRVEEAGARPGWSDYFDDYLKPRTFRYLPDLLELGLVPPVPGLYRQDLGGIAGPPLDAVVVSHAHMDHVGLLGLVRPDISVFASSESRAILTSMQETGANAPENDFFSTKTKGRVGPKKGGGLTTRPKFDDGPTRRFDAQAVGSAGDLSLHALPVDHSIPGAQAVLVEGAHGTLAYTGDFRLHGRGRHKSEKLVERIGGVGTLVVEGTNIHARGDTTHEKSTDDEASVEAAIDEAVRAEMARPGRTGFVGIAYPPRDLDRFVSILAVARSLGRRFAISTKQAHLIQELRRAGHDELPDPKTDRVLAVYFEASNKGLLLESADAIPVAAADLSVRPVRVGAAEYADLLASDYDEWAREFLTAPTMVGPLDVRREPGAYLFSISYWSITELFDIFPDPRRANGLYIHSQTQPFNDDMFQDRRKLFRWLKAYNLDFRETHVSGHLDQESLDWVLDRVGARTLVPVHSQAPGVTADRYRARTGHTAILPEWGKPLPLG